METKQLLNLQQKVLQLLMVTKQLLTTEIPSIAKIAVPKNRGSLSLGANHGTELESKETKNILKYLMNTSAN